MTTKNTSVDATDATQLASQKLQQQSHTQEWWIKTYGDAEKLHETQVMPQQLKQKDRNAYFVSQLCRERTCWAEFVHPDYKDLIIY
jgi:hypothetical protein